MKIKSVSVFVCCPGRNFVTVRIETSTVVCSPESGPLFELVPASDMELNYGQETEA